MDAIAAYRHPIPRYGKPADMVLKTTKRKPKNETCSFEACMAGAGGIDSMEP